MSIYENINKKHLNSLKSTVDPESLQRDQTLPAMLTLIPVLPGCSDYFGNVASLSGPFTIHFYSNVMLIHNLKLIYFWQLSVK